MAPDDDSILEALAGLPSIAPDTQWESRVRTRCHSAMSKRAARRKRAERDIRRTLLAAISSATVLFIYLAVTFAEALRLATHP